MKVLCCFPFTDCISPCAQAAIRIATVHQSDLDLCRHKGHSLQAQRPPLQAQGSEEEGKCNMDVSNEGVSEDENEDKMMPPSEK